MASYPQPSPAKSLNAAQLPTASTVLYFALLMRKIVFALGIKHAFSLFYSSLIGLHPSSIFSGLSSTASGSFTEHAKINACSYGSA